MRKPASSTSATAASIAAAASGWPSDQRSIIAADRIVPSGLARSCPAMSGAEPWIGSYRPCRPWAVCGSRATPTAACPSEPAITAASSDRMSPNRFSVTSTSKPAGHFASTIAAESTSRCSSVTSGKSAWTSSVTLRHRRLVARTFALSTWVTFRRRAARQLERQRHDPPDLALRVPQRVDGGAALRRLALLGRPAEVEAAGELADDQAVHALEQLGLERRGRDELRVDGDRAQVREQAEAAAQGEQRLLRADRRVRVVPLRPADRAQQHGVGRAARPPRPRGGSRRRRRRSPPRRR